MMCGLFLEFVHECMYDDDDYGFKDISLGKGMSGFALDTFCSLNKFGTYESARRQLYDMKIVELIHNYMVSIVKLSGFYVRIHQPQSTIHVILI